MSAGRHDVVIIGAGAAGLAAAIGLARAGFAVAVVEASLAPGAGVPPGTVYDAQFLAEPDLLGPDGVAALPWERRVVVRGLFATDGQGLLGLTYHDPAAFRHNYVVWRPDFDRRLGEIAAQHGAALLTETVARSLIRDGGRVIGVSTSAGPLYADLVFLAEGDPSYLLRREGYERPADGPCSLGVQRTVELPPGAVEERFGVGAGEGAAYEVLLRNPLRRGRPLPLNARVLIATQRQGVSLSLLVPLEHLRDGFDGEPDRLFSWLLGLPALRPWLRDGRPGPLSARVVRDGSVGPAPVVADGLAVGGGAAGLGVSFPFLNRIGPASASGLFLARAAAALRAGGGGFMQANLRRHYAGPLGQTAFVQDQEFLRRWPEYVRTAPALFGRDLDLALGTAHAWTRPRRSFVVRWLNGMEVLGRHAGPGAWPELRADLRRLLHALRWREVLPRPRWGLLLLDGTLNALRDLTRRPRPNLPAAGTVRFYYRAAGDEQEGRPGSLLRRWFHRFNRVLAPVVRVLWGSDPTPLAGRLPAAGRLLLEQVNLLDLLAAGGLALAAAASSAALAGWLALRRSSRSLPALYATAVRQALDLEKARPCHEDTPAGNRPLPLLRVLWPRSLAGRQAIGAGDFLRVCPARVFEVHAAPLNQPHVQVYPERCVACGACWRASELVDWGPDALLTGAPDTTGRCRPPDLLERLEGKLREFDAALEEKPATVDPGRADYLDMLARYAQQLALLVQEEAGRGAGRAEHLAAELAALAEVRARHAWEQHCSWAAADGLQMRQHHLPLLRSLLPAGGIGPAEDAASARGPDPGGRLSQARAIAEAACRSALGLALSRVHLLGLFRDEDGRDTIAKFGAVKELIAAIAAHCYLLDVLSQGTMPEGLALALAGDVLGTGPGSVADAAGQLAAIAGPPPDDGLAQAQHAAAEWHAPGSAAIEAYRRAGEALLRGAWPKDAEESAALAEMEQRRSLQAERDQTRQMETVLRGLVEETRAALPLADDTAAEAAETLGRVVAWVLGSKALLLQTHARLEQETGGETEVALLAVWLGTAGNAAGRWAAELRRSLAPPDAGPARPVVEPGAGPALRSYAEYLAAPAVYESGDYLVGPVDLTQPCLVPELAASPTVSITGRPGSRWGRALDLVRRLREEMGLCQALARQAGTPAWATWRLRHMEEELFIADSVAYDVAGRREHPGTRSLRLESAACRLLLGELRQRIGGAAAEIHGLAGDPQERSLADAEGHAAGQRFLILKELATRVAPRWAGQPGGPRHLGREVLELEALRTSFRQQVNAARSLAGDGLWQNPNLQAGCFLLADQAAWLAAADCVLHRLAWLSRRGQPDEEEAPALPLARRALGTCFLEVRLRQRQFEDVLAHLRRGYYAPAVRAANLLFRDKSLVPSP